MTVVPSAGADATEPAAESPSRLLRLVVLGPAVRAELVVPGGLPVLDLLPELARKAGLLDPTLVHGGYRLLRPGGSVLDPARTLLEQGIADGAVLTVEAGAHDDRARSYDDVVEAVADAVEASTRPWSVEAARRSALAAASVLLGVASVALGLERSEGPPVAIAAGVLAVLLVVGAAVLARAQDEPEVAAVCAWLALPPAGVAGLAAAPDAPLGDEPLLLAGAGAVVAAALGAPALRRRRSALLPGLGLGLLAALGGGLSWGTELDLPAVAAVAVSATVVLAALAPAVAVSRTRIRTPAPDTDLDPDESPVDIDALSVRDAVGRGRAVLLGIAVTVGALVVAAAPFLVHLGVSGLLLGVALAAVVLLRARRFRALVDVLVQLTSGVLALAVLTVAAALVHPNWRTGLAVALVAVGLVLLVASRLPTRSRLWLGRAGEVAEAVALIAALPLTVLAIGLISAVRS